MNKYKVLRSLVPTLIIFFEELVISFPFTVSACLFKDPAFQHIEIQIPLIILLFWLFLREKDGKVTPAPNA